MRASPWRVRGAIAASACLVIAMFATATANADPTPTADELQAEINQAREQVNTLQIQAAQAGEAYNGAVLELTLAQDEAKKASAALKDARQDLDAERADVAALTLEDLQSGTAMNRVSTMFSSKGPVELLERNTAYSSAQEAMAAHIARLDASSRIFDAARKRAEETQQTQRRLVDERAQAREAITAAVDTAQKKEADASTRREKLLRQLAKARRISLEEAKEHQRKIDRQIDRRRPAARTSSPSSSRKSSNNSQKSHGSGSRGSGSSSEPKRPHKPEHKPKPPAPAPSKSAVEQAISYAKAQLGKPYRWGGAGPGSFDCSGLTMRAYGSAGIHFPHYAPEQYKATRSVSVNHIKRGDLVFWSYGSVSSIYHVAIYLGNGKILQAPRPGRSVEIQPISYWIAPDLASRPAA